MFRFGVWSCLFECNHIRTLLSHRTSLRLQRGAGRGRRRSGGRTLGKMKSPFTFHSLTEESFWDLATFSARSTKLPASVKLVSLAARHQIGLVLFGSLSHFWGESSWNYRPGTRIPNPTEEAGPPPSSATHRARCQAGLLSPLSSLLSPLPSPLSPLPSLLSPLSSAPALLHTHT